MLRMAAFTNPQAVISQEDVRLSEPVRPHVPWRFLSKGLGSSLNIQQCVRQPGQLFAVHRVFRRAAD
jgi:hypothetical protein